MLASTDLAVSFCNSSSLSCKSLNSALRVCSCCCRPCADFNACSATSSRPLAATRARPSSNARCCCANLPRCDLQLHELCSPLGRVAFGIDKGHHVSLQSYTRELCVDIVENGFYRLPTSFNAGDLCSRISDAPVGVRELRRRWLPATRAATRSWSPACPGQIRAWRSPTPRTAPCPSRRTRRSRV